MKHCLVNRNSQLEMLDHDSFEEVGSDTAIPDAFWVHDHDRSLGAHAETRRLAALHTSWSEEEIFALEQLG
jgi:hypothetical protein